MCVGGRGGGGRRGEVWKEKEADKGEILYKGTYVCEITPAVNRCDLLYSFLSQTPAAHCSSSALLQNTGQGDNDRDT